MNVEKSFLFSFVLNRRRRRRMFEKMFSFICCCFPTEPPPPPPSSTKHKHYKHRTDFIISCPSSTPCYLSPIIIPCTPTITDSSRHPFCEDFTMSSNDDSTTMTTDVSSIQQLPSQSARISAIRELIETEQRYVKDLRIVANDFIKPLSNNRLLKHFEIEQLFGNWFNLIACNAVLLSSLQGQVQYREHITPLDDDDDLSSRSIRSVSMTNIALVAKANTHDSFTSHLSHCPSMKEIKKHRTIARSRRRSPSPTNLKSKRPISIERLDDNLVPQISQLSITSTMTIDESTCIGEILCSYLPYMADAYFEYCNHRSQANKYIQLKTDKNKDFHASILLFQKTNAGLSLNGFLTKPIQRVTRYPLLIEKILKHTLSDHPDYEPIQRALERARQINERIDKQISEQENYLRLDWLQQRVIFGTDEYSADGYIFDELIKFNSPTKYHPQRQFLLHGLLTKLPSGKELLVFLFNDFILLTTMKSSTSHWQTHLFEAKSNLQLKLYRSPILLIDIIAVTESNNDQLTFCLETKTFKKPLNLKTEFNNVRTLWVRSIINAMEECKAAGKSTVSNIPPEPVVAYLNLIVQEATITLPPSPPSARHRALNPYCEICVCNVTLKTPVLKRITNPKWNTPMQFALTDLHQNTIHINLFDHEFFSPDENIGYMTVNILDILPCPLDEFLSQSSHAFCHKIYLNNGVMITLQCAIEFLSLFQ